MAQHDSPARLRAISPRLSDLRRRRGQPWAAWLKGAGFLVFHIDLFLVGIAALLLLNVARAPDHLWITGVFWRWGLLLVIHGMVTMLIWLVGMLLSEERPGAGTYEAEWSTAPHSAGGEPVIAEPIDGAMPWVAPPDGFDAAPSANGWTARPSSPVTSGTPADGWEDGGEQRSSWAETSAPAWLARRRGEPAPPTDAPEQARDDA